MSDCSLLSDFVPWKSLDEPFEIFDGLVSFVLLRRELAALCGNASDSIRRAYLG